MKRALVTGASGFIGTHLVQQLSQRGIEVIGTDRFEPVSPLPCEHFEVEDLVEGTRWVKHLAHVDTVFHLAAIPSIARANEDEYQRVNVDGSARVAKVCRADGIQKIVHMSSSTVYGIPKSFPLPETAQIQPKNPYSRTKAEAEKAIRGTDNDIPTTIIRPRVVVGSGRAGIFALLFTCMKKGLPIPLFGGGQNYFQFTAVGDLVAATILAGEEDTGTAHETYNIGCDVLHTLREEIEGLLAASGSKSRLLSIPSKPLEWTLGGLHQVKLSPLVPEQYQIASANFVLDTQRAKDRLGFTPESANRDGLIEAWHWWNQEGGGPGGIRGMMKLWQPKYQNALQRREPK